MALLRPWELEDKRSFGGRRGRRGWIFYLGGFQTYIPFMNAEINKNEITAYSATVDAKGIKKKKNPTLCCEM